MKHQLSAFFGLAGFISLFTIHSVLAAQTREIHFLPPCGQISSNTMLDRFDIARMARKGTICVLIDEDRRFDRASIKTLIGLDAIVQIHSEKANLDRWDLTSISEAGKFILFVDGDRFTRSDLSNLMDKGVLLVIRAKTTKYERFDLMQLAEKGPFALIADSPERFDRNSLERFLEAGIILF